MEFIVNELSLSSQFSSLDDFLTSLPTTYDLVNFLKMKKFSITKINTLWSYKPISSHTLADITRIKSQSREKIRLLRMIITLTNTGQYWNDDRKHQEIDNYECSYTNNTSGYSIAEACERDKLIISFCNSIFSTRTFNVTKNTSLHIKICNFDCRDSVLDYLIYHDKKEFREYCKYKFTSSYKFEFCSLGDRFYIDDLIDSLTDQDVQLLVNKLNTIYYTYIDCNEQIPINFSKHIEGNIHEFRFDLPCRICRIFYSFNKNKTIKISHGFIKKDQKTPKNEIDLARKYLN